MGSTLRSLGRAARVPILVLLVIPAAPGQSVADPGTVTALGRLEPRDGVIRVAGPSRAAVVISELLVDEGDLLETGQLIAQLDSHARQRALVARAQARLEDAQHELGRTTDLQRGRAGSAADREQAEFALKVAEAELAAARADLSLSEVRAPSQGQVLVVHARAGERVGPEGILELGRTDRMYAIAEVYETDIGRVRKGQRATITSPALSAPLSGTVERIGLMVAKMDVLGTDPVAKTDARIVEVDVRLDGGKSTRALVYLQVTVEIDASSIE
ncbi:MAG: HlyD family efflux transporter periplasmic adaptor subunit [Myxococcota bacterium]|nr:HlyD family efflux transporter periplasmic adaptor subunit [Myxococcota bacterium]